MKPINQLSLGWRTHLIFPRFDAQVIARADYLLVRTPHNPAFWWGNFLLFDHVPAHGEATRWLARFDTEFADQRSESGHIALGIDSHDPFEMPHELLRAGFTRHSEAVLTMRRSELRDPPSPLPSGFRIAVLDLPAQLSLAVEQQVASDEGDHQPVAGYRAFRQRQMLRYTAMVQAGQGHWFGVFASTGNGEELVADCGVFRDGDAGHASDNAATSVGRFQFVSTHPAWRRRGLCRALIRSACWHGFDTMGLHTLVIAADPDDVAISLYESLGFQRGVSTWHFERRPDTAAV